MKVLSLFDGMACGMIAMQKAGIEIDRYVAYEIDKYAVQTATHNFPMIEQRGDVFQADFTEYFGFDFLIGGSPCTYWSIAQKNNRETEASGMGWELFSQYVRALHEAKPRFFVYENNKSMAKAIRDSIDKAFGFEAIGINSALLSAQNRQRLYWVGKRNEDGTYSKVPIEQPEDLGILLKDVLEGAPFGETADGKSFCQTARYYKGIGTAPNKVLEKSRDTMVAEPVNVTADGKAQILKANYYKTSVANILNGDGGMKFAASGVAEPVCLNSKSGRGGVEGLQPSLQDRIYSIEGKHTAVTTAFMPKEDGKTNVLTTVQKDNNVAEPVGVLDHVCDYGVSSENTLRVAYTKADEMQQGYRVYSTEHKSVCLRAQGNGRGAELIAVPVRVGALPRPNGELSTSQAFRVYSTEGKSVNLTAQGGGAGTKTGLYAIPCCNMSVKEATKKRLYRNRADGLCGHDTAKQQDQKRAQHGR